jgi:tol-pal system protein YbgF
VNQRHCIPISVVFVLACAPAKRLEVTVEALERKHVALQAEQAETQRKLEDLSNSLMILNDRLETLHVAAERQPPPVTHPVKSRSSKPTKPKAASPKEETEEGSIFGFGQGGGRHLPAITLSNRDLEAVDPKVKAKEPVKPEEERASSGVPENPEAARAYNEAFKKFEDGNYPEAIRMLSEFSLRYPTHVYSDNALYWVGESLFRLREFGKAAEAFERVGRDFPSGNKVPDALLRAASCYLRLGKAAEAKRALEKILGTYPQSVAAQKARASLKEI